MSFVVGRLVCAIIPFGESEDVIKTNPDTNSIIGYDQYRRLKRVLSGSRVELFDKSTEYDASDILIVMSTIWTVPTQIFEIFTRVVYFYDDIEVWKAKTPQYADSMKYVDMVLHPEPDVVTELRAYLDVPTLYMPWSSASLPASAPRREGRPKIFLDIDDRQFAADSVERAARFIGDLKDCDIEICVTDTFVKLLPDDLISQVRSVPRMPHSEFLEFIAGMSWYASGISSSYEYVVMESALLGCGLISLFNAVRGFHRNRACVLDYKGSASIRDDILNSQHHLQIDVIKSTSAELYPFDAVSAVPSILQDAF